VDGSACARAALILALTEADRRGAELYVVAACPGMLPWDGRGAVRSALLGSVALHCVTHARCPVMVVHPQPTAATPVTAEAQAAGQPVPAGG
jgi:nucleotide-binding universal stress UspA family protein